MGIGREFQVEKTAYAKSLGGMAAYGKGTGIPGKQRKKEET